MLMSVFDVVKGKRLEAIEFEGHRWEGEFQRVDLTFEGGIILRFESELMPALQAVIKGSLDNKEGVSGGE